MSLKHTLLGFVSLMQPVSGYDLKRWFEGSVNFYWPATHTQIYRTLNNLLDDELVERAVVEQEDVPDKKVYSITDAGMQELRDWLVTPLDLPTIRHGILIQLSFADLLEDEEILAIYQNFEANIKERLDLLTMENVKQLDYARTERERFLWNCTLTNGIAYYQNELAWVQQTIEEFKEQFMSGE